MTTPIGLSTRASTEAKGPSWDGCTSAPTRMAAATLGRSRDPSPGSNRMATSFRYPPLATPIIESSPPRSKNLPGKGQCRRKADSRSAVSALAPQNLRHARLRGRQIRLVFNGLAIFGQSVVGVSLLQQHFGEVVVGLGEGRARLDGPAEVFKRLVRLARLT